MPFVDITGPIVSDTVYVDNALVAKDVSISMPEVAAITADIQAMGTMSLPIWQLIDDMELAITKIGADKGLSKMIKPQNLPLEVRWVQTITDANGVTKNVGCKAFFKCIPKVIPGLELAVGESSEIEVTATVMRYQLFVNGEEIFLIDRMAGIVRINGTDYTSGVSSLL